MRKKIVALALIAGLAMSCVPWAEGNFTAVYAATLAATEEDEFFVIQDGELLEYKGTERDVVIPDSVTSIDTHAFWRCTELTALTIPAAVTAIGEDAFPYCERLDAVYYGGSEEDWNQMEIGAGNEILVNAAIHYNSPIPTTVTASTTANTTVAESKTTTRSKDDSVTKSETSARDKDDSVTPAETIPVGAATTGKWLSYKWEYSGDDGAHWFKNFMAATALENLTGSVYIRCIATDKDGRSATLYRHLYNPGEPYAGSKTPVTPEDVALPVITEQPEEVYAHTGETVSFQIKATGDGLRYQWLFSDGETWYDTGCTERTYSTTLTGEIDGRQMCCLVTDRYGNMVRSSAERMHVMDEFLIVDGVLLSYQGNESDHVIIPDGVTTISRLAFGAGALDYSWIKHITIPASVTEIELNEESEYNHTGYWEVFCGCDLQDIEVANGNPCFASKDGVLYNQDFTKLLYFPNAKTGHYTVPDTVTSIGKRAFYCCSLTSLTLPDSVTMVEEEALVSGSLTDVFFSRSLVYLGKNVFGYHNERYGANDRYAAGMQNVTVEDGNPCFASQNGVLFNQDFTKLLYYPIGRTDESYEIPDTVTEIGDYAFADCETLLDVSIPDSVTSIGASHQIVIAYPSEHDFFCQ